MIWSPDVIFKLRKRLEWGKQEFANRFGHKVDIITQLESGDIKPDKSMISQYEHLSECITKHVENLSLSPQIDDHFQNNESEQIHRNELNIYKNN
ncbi:MAG: hypothetical protein MK008_04660 [Bdellovibrionales bacterium]|nr:hypothetical protein [Bdellovibrionales bacterium]